MFDFGVGYSELFVLALLAVIVIGPKDLPKVLRTFGQFMNKARGMAREFQGHVDAAMKDAGIDDLKKEAQGVKSSMSSSLSVPNLMGGSGGAAATQSRQSNDFDSLFGSAPEAGETKVAGNTVTAEAAKPAPTS
jgi:sec-independent protein translocase protein TatB